MNTETEKVGGRLTGELAEELEEEHGSDTIGAAMVVASQCHHPVGCGNGGAAQCPRPSGQAPHRTWRGCRGCRRHPTGEAAETPQQALRRGAETPARSSQSRSSRRGEIDQGDARRRWRRTVAKPTNCHNQMNEREEAERMPRMATAELAGAHRNHATKSPAILIRQREESDYS
jgi:hypothetical protein